MDFVSWLTTGLILCLWLILPGYLWGRWLWDWRTWPWLSRWPVAFVLGLGFLNVLAIMGQKLGFSLAMVEWTGLGGTVLLWGAGWVRRAAEPGGTQKNSREVVGTGGNSLIAASPRPPITASLWSRSEVWVTLALCLLVGVLFLRTASSASFEDDRFYLAFIRHYQEDDLSPTFWPVVHESGQGSPATVARASWNGWWVVLAGLNDLSGVALPDWYARYFLFYLLMMSLAAAYTLTFTLSHNHRAATFTIALQLLIALTSLNSHEWLGRAFFDRLIEDKFLVVLIVLPVAHSFLYRFLVHKERRLGLALVLAGLALALTHPVGLGQWAISGVGLLGAILLPQVLTDSRRRIGRFLIAGMLGLGLLWLGRYWLLSGGLNIGLADNATQIVQDRTRLIVLSQSWGLYLAHPHGVAHPLTLLALGLVVWWWRHKRGNAAATFLLTATFIPLLLIYNPLTAPLLGIIIPPTLLYRLVWVIPVAPILALSLSDMPPRFWPRSRFRQTHFLALSLPLLGLPLYGYVYDGLALLRAQKQAEMPVAQVELLDELAQMVESGDLVVAPEPFNDAIPTWTSRARLLRFHLDNGPYPYQLDRAQFYAQPWVVTSTLAQLEEWDARFIILPPEHPLGEQIAGLPDLFDLRFGNEAGQIWQWQGNAAAPPPLIQANTHLIQGRCDTATPLYHQTLEDSRDSHLPSSALASPELTMALAHLGLGICQWAGGDSAAARQSWQHVLALNPASLQARLWLFWLAREEGDDAAATRHLSTAIADHPQALWLHRVWGEWLWVRGDAAAAGEQLALAVTASPGSGAYYLELGQLLQRQGLNTQALIAYQQVLALDDSPLSAATGTPLLPLWFANPYQNPQAMRVVQAYQGLAQVWAGQGELALAETAYRELISLAPNEPIGVAPLAQQMIEQGHADDALLLYQQALWRNPFLAWSHQQYGGLLLRTGQPQRAAFHLRWASELDQENVWVYRQLAQSYHQQGEPEQALALYEQVVAEHPWWIDGYAGLGEQLAAAHRLAEAEQVYQEIVERLATLAAAYPPLAEFYARNEQWAEVITLYEGAVASAPTQSWPYVALAQAYQNNQQPEMARPVWQQAITQDPGQIMLYHNLAELSRQQNDPISAQTLAYLADYLTLMSAALSPE